MGTLTETSNDWTTVQAMRQIMLCGLLFFSANSLIGTVLLPSVHRFSYACVEICDRWLPNGSLSQFVMSAPKSTQSDNRTHSELRSPSRDEHPEAQHEDQHDHRRGGEQPPHGWVGVGRGADHGLRHGPPDTEAWSSTARFATP